MTEHELKMKIESYKTCFRDMIITMGKDLELRDSEIKGLKAENERLSMRLANADSDIEILKDKVSSLEDLYRQISDSDIDDEDLDIAEESVPF